MAEDWDLYAVVRGCRSSTATETSPTATTIPSTTSFRDTSLSCLATLSFKEENDPFSFPSLIKPRTNGFQELHQLFTPFIPTATTTPTTSGFSIYLNSAFPNSADAGSIGQQQHHPALPATSHTSTRPQFKPEASTSGFERFHDQLQQQPQQVQQPQQQQQNQNQLQQFQVPQRSDSAMTLPNTQAVQTPRSRKRKSQQKRMVCHVTAENLSADLWAWRKYGQKPIKGSPYPRNYYRCSSSKGCVARKQVERSTTEPDTFIVTYTGDHTHPLPTHRNSLAGSTRNKPSTTLKPASHGSGSPGNITNRASSSSSLSATTLLTAPAENEEGADDPAINKEIASPDQDDEKDMTSDDDILIPNMTAMMDNIFLGVHQFGSGSGGGEGGDRSVFVNPTEGSSSNSQPGLTPAPWSHLSNYGRASPG